MGRKTVSVVIPAYSSSGTIVEALDSVLAQKPATGVTEIIVVDDCSPDHTCDVVQKWGVGSGLWSVDSGVPLSDIETVHPLPSTVHVAPSLRLVRLPENGGPARARNAGVREAQGEWIAFLDADDAWLPDRLEIQMSVVKENPDVAMICGGTVPLGVDPTSPRLRRASGGEWGVESGELIGSGADGLCGGEVTTDPTSPQELRRASSSEGTEREWGKGKKGDIRELGLEAFAYRNPVATSTVLLRKDAFEIAGGFREEFRGPEDYDLWMRIAARGRCCRVARPLSRYRHVEGSLSLDDRTFLPQVLSVLDAAYGPGGVMEERFSKRRAVSHQQLAAAWMAMERGAVLRAWSLYARGFITWPFSKGDPSFRLEKTKLAVALLRAMLRRGAVNKS